MTTWTRDTAWRQSSLISREDLETLEVPLSGSHTLGLVISHDCDLASDNLYQEPDVEVIPLESQHAVDNNLTHGKNPRRLHFVLYDECGSERAWQASASDKRRLPKKQLAQIQPCSDYTPIGHFGDVLQRWLACRYKRQALPNALMRRIRSLLKDITTQAKKQPDALVGIWIAFDPPEEADAQTPYEINLFFVYTVDVSDAGESARLVAAAVQQRCERRAATGDNNEAVYLERCQATSEEAFTLWDMRHTTELKLDHLSVREEETGPMAP